MILGALYIIVIGIFYIFGVGFASIIHFKGFALGAILNGIILIILGIIILSSYGLLKTSLKLELNWLISLILGIIALIFGGGLGAIVIIIAAIIDLIRESM